MIINTKLLINMLSDEDRKQLKGANNDKELKKIFKLIASNNPYEFFPTEELKHLGYIRSCLLYTSPSPRDRS